MVDLSDEISAYKRLLPTIRAEHHSCWALIVGGVFEGAFADFGDAAASAVTRFEGRPILIRHTDEVIETLPFLFVEN